MKELFAVVGLLLVVFIVFYFSLVPGKIKESNRVSYGFYYSLRSKLGYKIYEGFCILFTIKN